MCKDKKTEEQTKKAWFEKDPKDWDENDEQEAYMYLFIEPYGQNN